MIFDGGPNVCDLSIPEGCLLVYDEKEIKGFYRNGAVAQFGKSVWFAIKMLRVRIFCSTKII